MKTMLLALALCVSLPACRQNTDDAAAAPTESADTVSPTATPTTTPKTAPLPPEDGFKTPLPADVVLNQPYKVRMDVPVPQAKGTGRRTEFSFLSGDSFAAMDSFAASMTAAGFKPIAPATSESGMVRQAFTKAGYGAVFARSENATGEKLGDPDAKGFLVAAWPPTPAAAMTESVP